jgi:hypothetical protein
MGGRVSGALRTSAVGVGRSLFQRDSCWIVEMYEPQNLDLGRPGKKIKPRSYLVDRGKKSQPGI